MLSTDARDFLLQTLNFLLLTVANGLENQSRDILWRVCSSPQTWYPSIFCSSTLKSLNICSLRTNSNRESGRRAATNRCSSLAQTLFLPLISFQHRFFLSVEIFDFLSMIIRQRDDLLAAKIGFLRHVVSVFGLCIAMEMEQRTRAEPTVSMRMRVASSFSHLFSSSLQEKSPSSVRRRVTYVERRRSLMSARSRTFRFSLAKDRTNSR